MADPGVSRRIPHTVTESRAPERVPPPGVASHPLITREWLVTNGTGGYASGTLANMPTRRYHGVLVAALPNPLGRTVMLTELAERVRLRDGTVRSLSGEERAPGELVLPAAEHFDGFRLERGLPVWRFRVGDCVLEKQVWMPCQQNTVFVRYRLIEGGGLRLNLRPALNWRAVEDPVSTPLRSHYRLTIIDHRIEITSDIHLPRLRLLQSGVEGAFTAAARTVRERLYRVEKDRGYDDTGDLWSPGWFRADLDAGDSVTLCASTEPWSTMLALDPDAAWEAEHERRERLLNAVPPSMRTSAAAELVIAADTFVVTPGYRAEDVARRRAAGDELRSIIAGYHWFTDWGRDTMIALEGLTLTTNRAQQAGEILRTFAQYTRDGLIPNMFPNGSSAGHYNTADATLWFFHALDRYVRATDDLLTLEQLMPTLRDIIEHHLRGTRFGIRVDRTDGLLTQGAEGVQLTWMDAKVDGWVVTPRRGKAVELNALWYNALRLMDGWNSLMEGRNGHESDGDVVAEYAAHAERARASFNERFWYAAGGYLYDVVDGEHGNDDALRPNQVFAVSLTHPVLERERWAPMLETVRDQLLTPVGLRSLAPGHPDYRATYEGNLRERDAAYHQGTVWPWLIGHFIDAWLRAHPGDEKWARGLLDGLIDHLDEFGVGSIAEIFDAEPPFRPRGCIAQAWSVAELLRSLASLQDAATVQ